MVQRNFSPIERSIVFALKGIIRGYQVAVSPMFPPSCRFYPSCSEYAYEAVKIHGAWHGSVLAVKRICRCNPWNDGGIDLVPSSQSQRTESNRS